MNARFQINRYGVIAVAFGLCFLVVIGRLFQLQVMDHQVYLGQAEEQHFGSIILPAKRGEILVKDDRSNTYYKLATNITQDLLYVDPALINNERDIATKLAPFIYQTLCSETARCQERLYNFLDESEVKLSAAERQKQEAERTELTREAALPRIVDHVIRQISTKEVTRVVLKQSYGVNPADEELFNRIREANLEGIEVANTTIVAYPLQIRNPAEVAAKLSPLLNTGAESLAKKISRRPLRYVPLVNRINPDLSDKIRDLKLDGVVLVPEHWRFYPEKSLAAALIGFLDNDGVGQYGIERRFDQELSGINGEIDSKNDPFGRQLLTDQSRIKPAQDGDSVVLTINREVQAEIEKMLKKAVEDTRARGGQVLVMNPFTGEIIAMAQYPSFDPNRYYEAFNTKEISFDPGKYMTILKKLDPRKYLVYENRLGPEVFLSANTGISYEPGSIFKPLTVATAIDSGEITPRTTYYDSGEMAVDEYTIRNVSKECIGRHTMEHALNFSCNTGMGYIAKKLGRSLFYSYIINFGFGERTDIELDAEEKGFVRYFRNWAASNLATISFGQGITVTPIQMAVSYSALANGGLILQPRLVKEVVRSDGTHEVRETEVVRRVISKETADTITAMLISSTENGFAKKARQPRYYMAGKTGTSQIAYTDRPGFEEGEGSTITSFAGYAPANATSGTKFVVIAKLERPRTSVFSESTVTPLFKDVMAFLLEYYNVPPDR